MMRKLMHNSLTAAGFAALLLVGACASTTNPDAGEATRDNDDLVHVTQTSAVVPAAGPALVDSDGNVYSSSAAPGAGNASSVGTNTNVNTVPQQSRVDVATTTTLDTTRTDTTMVDTTADTTITTTTPTTTTTRETVVETTVPSTTTKTTTTKTTPMTSSSQVETTTTEETTTRTRMRKD